MTRRRMFSSLITNTDMFLDMPASTQILYFHFCMHADDDGFVSNPKRIIRMVGSSDDDLKILIAKQFIIPFESGICVIKHWRVHNYIRKDRYNSTFHKYEKELLDINKNQEYQLIKQVPPTYLISNSKEKVVYQPVTNPHTNGIPTGNQPVTNPHTQVRLGKVRLGKVRLGKVRDRVRLRKGGIRGKTNNKKITQKKNKYAEFVTMTTDEYSSLVAKLSSEERANRCIEILDNYKGANGKKYKSDYRAILNWVIRRLEEEEKEQRGPSQKRIPRAFASIQETLERMKDNDNGTS